VSIIFNGVVDIGQDENSDANAPTCTYHWAC